MSMKHLFCLRIYRHSRHTLRYNPTTKTEAKQYGYEDLTYGFLGYPVSQAADITFCKADLVPVGEDQLPHMEQTRKIVRRFNELYGKGQEILKEPDTLLSPTPRLVGLDGRIRLSDKGNPDICTVSQYHKAFNSDEYEDICDRCRGANMGCVACKKRLADCMNRILEPMREKRAYYERHLDEVKELIINGSQKANRIGDATMEEVKVAMNIQL